MPVERIDEDGVTRLVLDRPERLNALDEPMREDLIGHLRDLHRDPAPRCLVIEGAGGAFCSGADVRAMGERRDFRAQRQVIRSNAHVYVPLIHDLDMPVIAAVSGHAAGVGWSIALACDAVLCDETARFTAAFGRIGLAPDGGFTWHLVRACGLFAAKEIVFGARTLTGAEAASLGLVTRLVPTGSLPEETAALARAWSQGPTFAIVQARKQFAAALAPSLGTFLEHEALMQPALHASTDAAEGKAAFRERRAAAFIGR